MKNEQESLNAQEKSVQLEFEDRLKTTKLLFSEKGMNSELYFRNEDERNYIHLVYFFFRALIDSISIWCFFFSFSLNILFFSVYIFLILFSYTLSLHSFYSLHYLSFYAYTFLSFSLCFLPLSFFSKGPYLSTIRRGNSRPSHVTL